MKRALIITYYWPPSGGAGVQRWLKFVKYLRLFGWEPVVYCPENPEYPETDLSLLGDVPGDLEILQHPVWEPYNIYKRFIGRKKEERISAAFLTEKKKTGILEGISVWIRGNLFIPDARMFWIRPSARYLAKYLAARPVAAIVSTGPPHSTHLIARRLTRKMKIPWLADFRDPWTNIDFYRQLKLTRCADNLHHRLERSVLSSADAVVAISRSMAADFNRIYSREYDILTNGYDTDDIMDPAPEPDVKFSVAHIGSLVKSRNPVTLWKALQNLVSTDRLFARDLEIKLVGRVDYSVTASIEDHGLAGFVRKIDYLPHDEVVRRQQQSQVLLLIINDTANAKMILTGKFFEYLAARRPILCLGPAGGDAAAILKETNTGLLAGFGDVEAMQLHILRYYSMYKSQSLSVQSHNVDQYSRKALTGKLAQILERISR